MTILKFILESGAANSSEIIALKRTDPAGYDYLVRVAREQAKNQGVAIEEAQAK